MSTLNFNTAGKEDMDDFSVLPAGKYNVQIVKSDIVENSKKTGNLLKLQFKVIDGKFKARIVFGQYNLTNSTSPQAVAISEKQINTLIKAIGKEGIGETSEMHGIPLCIKLKVKPASGPYAESNDITFYAKYEGPISEAGSSEATPDNASNSGASETKKPAWMEKD